MKLLWNNSTSNDMQLSREKMDDIMWKIGLYITYGEVKIQDSCFKTPDYYPHELSAIILSKKGTFKFKYYHEIAIRENNITI
jgi:hypothetical protein